jgi:hypothetical protein
MNPLLLIPGLVSLILVLRGRPKTALLSVYLPSLLLLPEDYGVRLPHLPPFSTAEFALIPIGLVALYRHIRTGSFRIMDALVLLFWVSWTISELSGEPVTNDGVFSALSAIVIYLMTYATGRRLIEPTLRMETVRRIVICILVLGPIGLYEWRFASSPYSIIGQKVLGIASSSSYTGIQIRNGRGRFSVSLGGGELAGLVIALTFCLNAWLVFMNKARTEVGLGKRFAQLEKYHVPELLLLLYIWLTQSRGPMLALAGGFPILQIPRFKSPKLGIVLVAIVLGIGALGAYQYFTRYTDVSDAAVTSEQQGSALYRKEMNIAYESVAEKGGWLGWSAGAVPEVGGMKSIDNHFLLVHLMQGKLGYILWLLITAESIRTGVMCLWRAQTSEDRAFACSMLAVFVTLWVTLYTVYMGNQLPQLTFLLLGWGQSITTPGTQSRFSFKRVFS